MPKVVTRCSYNIMSLQDMATKRWIWIVWMLARAARNPVSFCIALSLILGGALGNVIDRVRLGAVVDFLHFHWGPHYWPAFNVADSAITCGAALLLFDAFFQGRKARTGSSRAATP